MSLCLRSQAGKALNTLKSHSLKKEAEALQLRIAQCEAASHLMNTKKMLGMKSNILHENLLVLTDHKKSFPLELRMRVVQRMAGDVLQGIDKQMQTQTQTNATTEDLKRWTMHIMPWQCVGVADNASDLDPKNPAFHRLVGDISVVGDDMESEDDSCEGTNEQDESWLKMLEAALNSCVVFTPQTGDFVGVTKLHFDKGPGLRLG